MLIFTILLSLSLGRRARKNTSISIAAHQTIWSQTIHRMIDTNIYFCFANITNNRIRVNNSWLNRSSTCFYVYSYYESNLHSTTSILTALRANSKWSSTGTFNRYIHSVNWYFRVIRISKEGETPILTAHAKENHLFSLNFNRSINMMKLMHEIAEVVLDQCAVHMSQIYSHTQREKERPFCH